MSQLQKSKQNQHLGRVIAMLLGGGVGWVLLGPIGVLLGTALGALLDTDFIERRSPYGPTLAGDYNSALAVLIAAVMKADGRVVRSELNYVKAYLRRNYTEEDAKEILLFIRDLTKQTIPIEDVSRQIGQHMDYAARMQLLHFLYGLAEADGFIDRMEVRIIHYIGHYMGITNEDIRSLFSMFAHKKSDDTESSYAVLGVDKNASDDDVRKAYRKKAVEYHPDKVSHLSEEAQQAAKEKFQQLNAAYQRIKKARNLS